MDRLQQVVIRWLPAAATMALIFAFSSFPQGTLPNFNAWDFVIKKIVHALVYATLAIAYLWALTGWRDVRPLHFAAAALLAAFYGVTDEVHQRFVPWREGTLLDVGIDAAGAGLGMVGWIWVKRTFGYW